MTYKQLSLDDFIDYRARTVASGDRPYIALGIKSRDGSMSCVLSLPEDMGAEVIERIGERVNVKYRAKDMTLAIVPGEALKVSRPRVGHYYYLSLGSRAKDFVNKFGRHRHYVDEGEWCRSGDEPVCMLRFTGETRGDL